MSRAERRAMVTRPHPGLSLSRQCRLLSIGRSSLYYTPKGESAESLALMQRIDELFLKHPFYGARQMVRHLRLEGVRIGRRRASRLMRLMGLQAIYRAPRTSDPHPEHRVYPYLLKDMSINRSNQVCKQGVTGSSPVTSTNLTYWFQKRHKGPPVPTTLSRGGGVPVRKLGLTHLFKKLS